MAAMPTGSINKRLDNDPPDGSLSVSDPVRQTWQATGEVDPQMLTRGHHNHLTADAFP